MDSGILMEILERKAAALEAGCVFGWEQALARAADVLLAATEGRLSPLGRFCLRAGLVRAGADLSRRRALI